MWIFLLHLRILLGSNVLVLIDKNFRFPTTVAAYMYTKNIPFENRREYENWNVSECYTEGNDFKAYTKLYLWEGYGQWIFNRKWINGNLIKFLETCMDIIEVNIDGGEF